MHVNDFIYKVFKGRRSLSEGKNHPRMEQINLADEGQIYQVQKAAFSRHSFPTATPCAKGMIISLK